MVHYTEGTILKGIKEKKNEIFEYIYEQYFPSIDFLITTNNGNNDEASDIFQEALILIYEKLKKEELNLNCSIKTYLYSICRNLWFEYLRSRKKIQYEIIDSENFVETEDNFSNIINENEEYNLFYSNFLKLSEGCQEILTLFFKKTPAKEIAKIMGFKSVQYVGKRKHQCKEYLLSMIKKRSEI